jgi:hypothetical protein
MTKETSVEVAVSLTSNLIGTAGTFRTEPIQVVGTTLTAGAGVAMDGRYFLSPPGPFGVEALAYEPLFNQRVVRFRSHPEAKEEPTSTNSHLFLAVLGLFSLATAILTGTNPKAKVPSKKRVSSREEACIPEALEEEPQEAHREEEVPRGTV